eukprot:scaffold16423_cov55-Cyclotella_meneghiniana.AAC.2
MITIPTDSHLSEQAINDNENPKMQARPNRTRSARQPATGERIEGRRSSSERRRSASSATRRGVHQQQQDGSGRTAVAGQQRQDGGSSTAATGRQQQKGSQRAQEAPVDMERERGGASEVRMGPSTQEEQSNGRELTQQSTRKRIAPAAIAEETAEGWKWMAMRLIRRSVWLRQSGFPDL